MGRNLLKDVMANYSPDLLDCSRRMVPQVPSDPKISVKFLKFFGQYFIYFS